MKLLKTTLCLVFAIAVSTQSFAQKINTSDLDEGIYTLFETTKGEILVRMYYQQAPLTVANFVGLAEGKIPNRIKSMNVPYFDGMSFHRVIANFMIQGGDPNGNGSGDPGYLFKDEFNPLLKHDGPGVLSMANRGPNTNGSQFFITHRATPHLDGKHAVFGRVLQGQDVVDAIRQGDLIKKLTIIRVGDTAKAFDAHKVFEKLK